MPMGIFMKESGIKGKNRASESISTTREKSMKVNGKMTFKMEKESSSIPMGINMKERGLTGRNPVKARTTTIRVINMRGSCLSREWK